MLARYFVYAGIVALSIGTITGKLSAQGPSAARPILKIGDTWTYSVTQSLTEGEPDSRYEVVVASITPENIIAQWQNPVLRLTGTVLFDHDLNLVKNARDNGIVTYEANPSYPGYRWPLFVGASWQYGFQYKLSGGRQYRATLSSQVAAMENVTVPGGRFDTFKIHRTLQYQGFDNVNAWGGTLTEVVWYAPQVKSIARSERTDSGIRYRASGTEARELLSYRVQ